MNEVTKQLMCVKLRNGIDFWLEDERATKLKAMLLNGENRFIEMDGEIFNRADIVGVFSAKTLEAHTRKQNGQWECKHATWHNRGERCECEVTTEDFTHLSPISEEERKANLAALARVKKQYALHEI